MLKVTNLHKTYYVEGKPVQAVRGVSFNIDKGDVYTLLGPSGCGKTTILRCVAGLEKPDEGAIVLGGKILYSNSNGISIPPYHRNLGMVFQSYAIWPHMNVFDNVAFPLYYGGRKNSSREIRECVLRALKLVQLEGTENRSATLLSGGQQQRVALARALVYEPSVLLLDEPLSNLDARLRDSVRKELKELVKRLNLTVLYVTHDQVEALSLSDRIAVMRSGVIVQEGSPSDIYLLPKEPFVGEFVGKANLINGVITITDDLTGKCTVRTDLGQFQGTCSKAICGKGDKVVFLIRPDIIKLYPRKPDSDINILEAEVKVLTFTGALTECVLSSREGVRLEVQASGLVQLEIGQKVYLQFSPELCRVLRAS